MSVQSISDIQQAIEEALLSLRRTQFPPEFLQARDCLIPVGYRPIVTLREDGEAKPKNESANHWSPQRGQITIHFEPETPQLLQEHQPVSPSRAMESSHMEDLLSALNQAETVPGRSFVALKWFRDEWLPGAVQGWTQSADLRQEVLSQAIGDGWVLTSKVPNPKAPLYPTTTIRLNRQKGPQATAQVRSRFRPAAISGEPLSATILRDRGKR